MRYGLNVTTKPSEEPITLAEAKAQCRIDATDTAEDGWLNTIIIAARIWAENYQNRAFVTRTYELWFDCIPSGTIKLLRPPLIEVLSVKYYGTDNTEYDFDVTDLIVDTKREPGRITPVYGVSWPSTELRAIDSFVINYTAGYGAAADVPSITKCAMLLFIGHAYENRSGEVPQMPENVSDMLRPDRVFHEF